ncbi:uncharacterized protein LOC124377357 [Tachysurus ichikawai]
MNPERLNTVKLPQTLFTGCFMSLMVYGARLSVRDPSLSQSLFTSGVTTLKHLVDNTSPHLKNTDGVAAQVDVKSMRVVSQLLRKWTSIVSHEER